MGCSSLPDAFLLFDNVLFHIFILFILLSILFLFVISKVTSSAVNNAFNGYVDSVIDSDSISKKLPPDFESIKENISEMFENTGSFFSKTTDPFKKERNDNITISLCMIITFMLVIIIIVNYMTSTENRCDVINKVAPELLVVFICVGLVEYFFFTKVAMKYVPGTNATSLDSFKKKMNEIINI